MQEVWVEEKNGKKKCVDSADSEAEALYLVQEYRVAYGPSARRVWLKLKED